MLEFRKHSTRERMPRRSGSLDGFSPRQTSSIEQSSEGSFIKGSRDSFHGNAIFAKPERAIETKATLPGQAMFDDRALTQARRQPIPPKKRKLRRIMPAIGRLSAVIAVLGLLYAGYFFGRAWLTAHKIFKGGGSSSVLFSTDIRPDQLKGEGDGRVNVLLLGIGGGNRDGANLTDSILIASIDPIAKDVALLSIPRDLWVSVPGYWDMKINAAYASALDKALNNGVSEVDAQAQGFESLENTIQEYIGIPIHYHALVNFQAFQEGVDAVGGIDVNVSEDLYDYVLAGENNGSSLIASKGLQHFDGRQALLYSQSRYSTSDFARAKRQREVVIALKSKVLSTGTFTSPTTVSKLINVLGNNVTTNISLNELMRMYELTKDIPDSSIANLGLTDEPNPLVTTGTVGDQSVVLPIAGLEDFSAIQAYVRTVLRDPFLKSENATIAVLNGTSLPGAASTKAEELKSYGYNVTVVDNAPTLDYGTTVLYDRSAGQKKYTQSFLERRLGVTISKQPATTEPLLTQTDFVIVVGTNETSTR